MRVLVIDDNHLNVELAIEVLEHAGHTVRAAYSADDGLAIARRERHDVILMDLRMPGRSGFDALNALRADAHTAGSRVVALTAQAMQGDEAAALAAGFDGYISKPINTGTFAAQVSAFAAGSEAR